MDVVQIGRYIALQRKKQHLTQMQLAEALGVSNRAVSKWETGRCLPDAALWVPLAEQLGIGIEELYFGADRESKAEEGASMTQKTADVDKEARRNRLIEEALLENVNFHERLRRAKDLFIGQSLLIFGFIVDIGTQIRGLELHLNPGSFDTVDRFFVGFQRGIPIALIIAGAAISAKGLVHVRSHRREAATESDDEGKR